MKGPKLEPKGELAARKDVQYALDFAPDDKTLATAGYDRVIRLWDTDTLKVVRELKDHSDTVYGRRVLAGRQAARLRVGRPGRQGVGPGDRQAALHARRPDRLGVRRRLAPGRQAARRRPAWTRASASGRRPPTAGKLVHSVFAHTEPVTRLAYSTDGQFLYSISEGPNLKKWDAARMVEKLVFPPQTETVLSLALRPDGKQLAVGRFDGVLQLIDADQGKVDSRAAAGEAEAARGRQADAEFRTARARRSKSSSRVQHLAGELARDVERAGRDRQGDAGRRDRRELRSSTSLPVRHRARSR